MESEYIGLIGVVIGAVISGAITFLMTKLSFKHEAKIRGENLKIEYHKTQLSQLEWLIKEITDINFNANKVMAGLDLLSKGIIDNSRYQDIKEELDFFGFLNKVNEIKKVILLHFPELSSNFGRYIKDATSLIGLLNGITPPINDRVEENMNLLKEQLKSSSTQMIESLNKKIENTKHLVYKLNV